jgi:hypothetical protein
MPGTSRFQPFRNRISKPTDSTRTILAAKFSPPDETVPVLLRCTSAFNFPRISFSICPSTRARTFFEPTEGLRIPAQDAGHFLPATGPPISSSNSFRNSSICRATKSEKLSNALQDSRLLNLTLSYGEVVLARKKAFGSLTSTARVKSKYPITGATFVPLGNP